MYMHILYIHILLDCCQCVAVYYFALKVEK